MTKLDDINTRILRHLTQDGRISNLEVRECHNVTGTVEYLLRVETRDLSHYKHWHTEILGVLPQVQAITTFVVMDSPKDDRS